MTKITLRAHLLATGIAVAATLSAALVPATAFANGKSPAELQQEAQLRQVSTVSRATVLAELAQARADGSLAASLNSEGHGSSAASGPSRLTRAEVLAQFREARTNGTLIVRADQEHHSLAYGGRLSGSRNAN